MMNPEVSLDDSLRVQYQRCGECIAALHGVRAHLRELDVPLALARIDSVLGGGA